MTATATATRVATEPRRAQRIAETRAILGMFAIVAMAIVLGVTLALSVVGAATRSDVEAPAPGLIPMEPPASAPESPAVRQPETAPPGLDL
ncbi:MAG TPA: hypothetical protein VFW95_09380 [Candidatus Limnocylindria bacterium]|nr:hypothetical protein [Candidatus Limnocylindria bacterium]